MDVVKGDNTLNEGSRKGKFQRRQYKTERTTENSRPMEKIYGLVCLLKQVDLSMFINKQVGYASRAKCKIGKRCCRQPEFISGKFDPELQVKICQKVMWLTFSEQTRKI